MSYRCISLHHTETVPGCRSYTNRSAICFSDVPLKDSLQAAFPAVFGMVLALGCSWVALRLCLQNQTTHSIQIWPEGKPDWTHRLWLLTLWWNRCYKSGVSREHDIRHLTAALTMHVMVQSRIFWQEREFWVIHRVRGKQKGVLNYSWEIQGDGSVSDHLIELRDMVW